MARSIRAALELVSGRGACTSRSRDSDRAVRSARLARWPTSQWLRSARRMIAPRPGAWLAGVAFAVQLDHHVGAQDGVLLLAPDPLVQLSRWPDSGRKGARVEPRTPDPMAVRQAGRCS